MHLDVWYNYPIHSPPQAHQRLGRISAARQRGYEGAAKRLLLILLSGLWRGVVAHRHQAEGRGAADELVRDILSGEEGRGNRQRSDPHFRAVGVEGDLNGQGAHNPTVTSDGDRTVVLDLSREEDQGGVVPGPCGQLDCRCCVDRQGCELELCALRERVAELDCCQVSSLNLTGLM